MQDIIAMSHSAVTLTGLIMYQFHRNKLFLVGSVNQ